MATNVGDVSFDEAADIQVDTINQVRGPWSNIKSVNQVV